MTDTPFLPKRVDHLIVPPLKCQGIKSKLVKFIALSIEWHGRGKWIEPFLGSGVVLFNINPPRALVADTNKHIIRFYRDVQEGIIDEMIVRSYLEYMGAELSKRGADFYYEVRERFNQEGGDSLRLLFLNRCCYNGIMRFNSEGRFNVPFGHKPHRFRRSYVTKIVNQVHRIRRIIQDKQWVFKVAHWKDTLTKAEYDDFVYMDPPYVGRHTDYFNQWTEDDAVELAEYASKLKCGFALSMWKENKYRHNRHIDLYWNRYVLKTFSHFYHVGSKEEFRNQMTEALILSAEHVASQESIEAASKRRSQQSEQLRIFD